MEYQSSLQKELQRAKQEAKEAIEARNQHAEEMKEFEDTMELLTLDKEMAEEKTEIIQTELVEAREKLEEMTLDLELLKAELSIKEGGGGGGATSYEVKQLEQHNAHLKDTVVRMRDLAAHLKHETQVLQKDLDQKNSEVRELARTKEKLSARIEGDGASDIRPPGA
ncbi:unnamed protein product, partial [Timema podura]|nr:unnamed protein product [Timema podura]